MGCGQSKINLYPRRNKNGGKGNGAKKSGGGSKESDDEEGNAGAAKPDDADDDTANDKNKQMLPLIAHAHTMVVSESQQDFFKILDEKIEQGRDYDSSSETEINLEQERRKLLLEQWPSPAQPSCPPTPVRRRVLMNQADRQSSPAAARRCCRPLPDGASPPPPRRAHSAQANHADPRYNPDWLREELNKSPNKRLHTTPAWKNQIKPCSHKPKRNDFNENQRIKKIDTESSHESGSSISSLSPTHSNKSQQPYMAQILAHSAQQLSPPATPKFIAPPEEYQDPQADHESESKYVASRQTNQQSPQPPIYFIHGSSNQNLAQDLQQQRQQTAFHLQQYVAMKQAQQQMFTYIQRGPHTVFPGPDYSQIDPSKAHEYAEYYSNTTVTAVRPHSAPTSMGPVRPIPLLPGYAAADRAHLPPGQMWSPMPPVVSSMGPWVPGQLPQDLAYYPQSQYLNMYRPNSAGSAGTLTRYKDKKIENAKDNVCQINLVRQKPVGQIVTGGQELTVCSAASSDSASPASVSTDSGVSPGNNTPKNTEFTPHPPPPSISQRDTHNNLPSASVDKKNKKNKSTFGRSLKNSKSLDSS